MFGVLSTAVFYCRLNAAPSNFVLERYNINTVIIIRILGVYALLL